MFKKLRTTQLIESKNITMGNESFTTLVNDILEIESKDTE